MSFIKSKELIEYGDLVVAYISFNQTTVFKVEKGKQTQIKYGAIKHDLLIGTKFGRRYKCAKGACILLAITAELWSLNLPHRTQILYSTDISMITSLLYLQPGFKVVEAGTGSGSLSHSIIRTIFPTGHLYTFDFHEERVKVANQEFKDHRLDNYVTCRQRDVCKEGFNLKNFVDAVFLDLPNPWEAIPFAYIALKNTSVTRICCFSPCIEQVQRTVESLEINSFIDIQTIECLNRPYEFKTLIMKSLNLNNDTELPDQKEVDVQEDETDKKSNAKNEDESMLSESNFVNSEGDNDFSKSNNKLKNGNDKHFILPTPLNRITGHTGYLTFATKL